MEHSTLYQVERLLVLFSLKIQHFALTVTQIIHQSTQEKRGTILMEITAPDKVTTILRHIMPQTQILVISLINIIGFIMVRQIRLNDHEKGFVYGTIMPTWIIPSGSSE